jgi:hypothetical protein
MPQQPNIRASGGTVCTLAHSVGVGKHLHDEVANIDGTND